MLYFYTLKIGASTKIKFYFLNNLDLASSLITALENSLNGSETKCTLETFEYYNQEIKTLSDGLEESKVSTSNY